MKINKIKPLLIAICSLMAALWSETQCMDDPPGVRLNPIKNMELYQLAMKQDRNGQHELAEFNYNLALSDKSLEPEFQGLVPTTKEDNKNYIQGRMYYNSESVPMGCHNRAPQGSEELLIMGGVGYIFGLTDLKKTFVPSGDYKYLWETADGLQTIIGSRKNLRERYLENKDPVVSSLNMDSLQTIIKPKKDLSKGFQFTTESYRF